MHLSIKKILALSAHCTIVLSSLLYDSAARALIAAVPDVDRAASTRFNESQRTFGSVSPKVHQAEDLGRISGSETLQGVTLLFKQTLSQSEGLKTLLAGQQSLGSESYHKWLSPDSYAARFGLDADSIDVVSRYLAAEGASHITINASRTTLSFDLSAARFERIFTTEFHRYNSRGQVVIANAAEVELPWDIVPFVDGVVHLNGFQPVRQVVVDNLAHTHPALTTVSGAHFTTPSDLIGIYDVGVLAASGFTGQGQHIAVAGQSAVDLNDVARFREAAGLGIRQPDLVLVPGTGVSLRKPGDELESDIDLEYSSALAPDANVTLVYTGDNSGYSAFDALAYSIDQDLAPVVSVSYGECEAALSESEIERVERVLMQANAQGQTVLVASGDLGATDCESAISQAEGSAQLGLAVRYPASSQYVTSVGGTMFSDSASNSHWSEQSGADGGSARSYIPERSWNESDTSGHTGLLGSGGGASVLFPKPVWQAGPGVPADSARDVPDIAMDAGVYDNGYVFCSSDPVSGIVGSCTHGFFDEQNLNLTTGGGTSFGAPIAAGIVALISQSAGVQRLGNINSMLYMLSSTTEAIFHDIVEGSNEQPCVLGSTDCSADGIVGYSAGLGYDLVTGLGTPDISRLAEAVSAVLKTPVYPISLALRKAGVPGSLENLQKVTATVSGVEKYLNGAIQFYLNSRVSGAVVPVQNGTAEYTLPLEAGTYTVSAVYTSGTPAAVATASLVVTIVSDQVTPPSFSLQATKYPLEEPDESGWNITAKPMGGYLGQITFSAATLDPRLVEVGCYSVQELSVGAGTAGNAAFRVGQSIAACDALAATGVRIRKLLLTRLEDTKEARVGMEHDSSNSLRSLCGIAQACVIMLLGSVRRRARLIASNLVLLLALASFCTGCSVHPTAKQPESGGQTITITGSDTKRPANSNSIEVQIG